MKRASILLCLLTSLFLIDQLWLTHAAQPSESFDIYLMKWSPDGSKIALTTSDGIRIYDPNFQLLGYYPTPSAPTPNTYVATPYAVWNPDGTRITAGSLILDSETLRPLVTTQAAMSLVQWTPDGKYVMAISGDYFAIEFYDALTGKLAREMTFDGFQLLGVPQIERTGTRFLLLSEVDTIAIADVTSGEIVARYEYPYRIDALSWSPDGKRIAYQSIEQVPMSTPGSLPQAGTDLGLLLHFFVIDAATGATLVKSEPLPNILGWLEWSPDGTKLTGRIAVREILTWDSTTGSLLESYYLPIGQSPSSGIYSPYGGSYMIAVGDAAYDNTQTNLLDVSVSSLAQTFLNGAIQIIVPTPSVEKLQAIASECGLQPSIEQLLDVQISSNALQSFTDQVSQSDDSQIPPGCKADLLAVANALMAQPHE